MCITQLGSGFLEKVYQNSLVIEIRSLGFSVEVEKPIKVYYNGEVVGNYVADIIVDGKVLLEIKAVKELSGIHEAQILNYLKATGIEVGLLINFGRSVNIKRRIMNKERICVISVNQWIKTYVRHRLTLVFTDYRSFAPLDPFKNSAWH